MSNLICTSRTAIGKVKLCHKLLIFARNRKWPWYVYTIYLSYIYIWLITKCLLVSKDLPGVLNIYCFKQFSYHPCIFLNQTSSQWHSYYCATPSLSHRLFKSNAMFAIPLWVWLSTIGGNNMTHWLLIWCNQQRNTLLS